MKKTYLRNPKGSRDWLPDEVIKQEYVRKVLTRIYELWGYQPIQTPILINWDTIAQSSSKLSDSAFKLIGQHGEVLALRADLTTPIARVTAERLQKKSMPFRFYYIGKVFRYHARKTTNERELYQIGIELIGAKEGPSDLECLKIFLESLEKLGFKKYMVLVNHTSLWSELFRYFGDTAKELHKALKEQDLILFKSILKKSNLSQSEKTFWSELIQIKGSLESLKQLKLTCRRVKKLKLKKIILYFENLLSIFDKNMCIDLSMTSDFDYYTGVYFEAITPQLGRRLGSGGRYDELISKFGFNAQAVGFSFCLEDLLLALEMQNKSFPEFKVPKLIKSADNLSKTFGLIKKMHQRNQHTTLKL